MRRLLALLLLVGVLFWTFQESPADVSLGGPKVIGNALNRHVQERPYSGTLCITIDDGLVWTYTDLLDTLRKINADSGLAGTQGEMHASVFLNLRGLNNLDDPFWGSPNAATLNSNEARALANSGIISVGLHGWTAALADPDAILSSPAKAIGFFGGPTNASALPDSNTSQKQLLVDGIKAIRDTLGIECDSFVCNGHRMTTFMSYLMNKYGINACRAGTRQTPLTGTDWPTAASGEPSSNLAQGKIRELNRQNIDMANMVLSSRISANGGHRMEAYLPFANFNRLWVAHLNPPTSSAENITGQPVVGSNAAREDTTKAIIYHLASMNALGVLVWHDINVDSGPESIGGLPGISRVLRYAAKYCKNLADGREGPRLQVLTLSEGVAKHADWRQCYAGQSFDAVGNFMLQKDEWRGSKPWGFHEGLEVVWSDSGWAYVDSASAAGNALFGPHNEGGLFRNVSAAGAPAALTQVFCVPPGATVTFGCMASADTFPAGGGPDSISTAKIEIDVSFLRAVPDPTDTTMAWARTPTTTVTEYVKRESWDALEGSSHSQVDWTGNATPRWATTKMWGAFHWRDQWRIARTQTGGAANNWWFLNDSIAADEEYAQRWRSFYTTEVVPGNARLAVVKYRPVGFLATAVTDTVLISGITVQVTPQ